MLDKELSMSNNNSTYPDILHILKSIFLLRRRGECLKAIMCMTFVCLANLGHF